MVPVVGDAAHQRLQELPAGQRVEARDRFVEQQQPRPLGQRERQRDLGPLAAGELADRLVRRDAELRQPRPRPGRVPRAGSACRPWSTSSAAVKSRYSGVSWATNPTSAQDGRVVVRRLAEDPDRAGVGPQQPDRQVQQRALAGAVRPDERGDPAGRQLQRAVPQRPGASRTACRAARSPAPCPSVVLSFRSLRCLLVRYVVGERGAHRRLDQGDDVLAASARRPAPGRSQATRSVAQLGLVGERRAGERAAGRTCRRPAGPPTSPSISSSR